MKLRSSVMALIAAIAVLAVVPACGADTSKPATSTIPLLRVGSVTLPPTVDSSQDYNDVTMSLAMEQLLTFNSQGQLVPELAQSESHPNPTTYIYDLRHGVKFWDGNEMTSTDVANALNFYRDPKYNLSASYMSVDSITATDKYTVTIVLQHPDASFEQALAWEGAIFEKKFYDAHKATFGQPGTMTMGTGPWILDSLDPTRNMEFTANAHWWAGKVNIQHITFKKFGDETAMALGLRAGEIDVAFPTLANAFGATSGAKIKSAPALAVGYLGLNYHLAPFSDVHVRRAIAYAMNKPQLIKASGNPGAVINDFIPPTQLRSLGSASEVDAVLKSLPQYPYSLAKAKAELAKSAYPNGFTTDFPAWTGTSQVAQAIAGMVKPLGITLNVTETTSIEFSRPLWEKKTDGAVWTTFNIPSPDPGAYPSWMLGTRNAAYGGWNWANYDPPAMAPLLVEGIQTVDPKKRLAIYAKVLDMVATDVPYVPLFISDYNVALSPKFTYPSFNFNYLRTEWALGVKPTSAGH